MNEHYFMEHPAEKERLKRQVNPKAWVNKYLTAHLAGTTQIVDVGCGPAVITKEVARVCPDAIINAIDISEDRIADASVQLASCRNATAVLGSATCLPFHSNSQDLVYSRFLLEYLPDKQGAVKEMYRVLRPGGTLVLQDVDGQLVWNYPENETLRAGITNILASLEQGGFDVFVGRKLYHLCHQAGFARIEVAVEPYDLIAGRCDPETLALWESKLSIALDTAGTILGDIDCARELKRQFLTYLLRDDTLTYSVLFTIVAKK